jgi:asparagine synthase (glutamine-hydrolysing)
LQRHSGRYPRLDWDEQPRLPQWVTPDAVSLVRQAFEAVLDSARPLGDSCGRHASILAIRSSARIVRSFAQLVAPTGLPLAAPLLDDQVIEACLAVRAHERTTPWEYKPLIKEAMRGIVPTWSLERVTKAEGSAEEEAGLRAWRDDLMALCDGSRLAASGLVDPDRLRAGCHYSPAPDRPHESLQQTIACEVWLRGITDTQHASVSRARRQER